MPTFLRALTVTSLAGAAVFFLFATGASLLWLAEVLEHNPRDARRWGRALIYIVSALLGLLYLVDGYPAQQTLLSVVALLVYFRVINSSPTPSLSSPTTSLILGIILLPITHLSWYWYFFHKQVLDTRTRPTYGRSARVERAQEHKYDSVDRLIFYAVCVWLVPFYVFLSLSSTPGKPASPSSTPTSALFPPPQDSYMASFLHRFLPRKYFRLRLDTTAGILSPRPVLPHSSSSISVLQASRSTGLVTPSDWSDEASRGGRMGSLSRAGSGQSIPMRRVSSATSLAMASQLSPTNDVFSPLRTSVEDASSSAVGGNGGSDSRRSSLSVEASRKLPVVRPVGRSATLGPETIDQRRKGVFAEDLAEEED